MHCNCNQACLFVVIYKCRNYIGCWHVHVACCFVPITYSIRSVSSFSLKLLLPMCFWLSAELCTSGDEVAWSKTAVWNCSAVIINLSMCKGNNRKARRLGKMYWKWKHGFAWKRALRTYLCLCTCVYLSKWLHALMLCWHHAPLQCMHPVYFVLSIFSVLCWLLSQLVPFQKRTVSSVSVHTDLSVCPYDS